MLAKQNQQQIAQKQMKNKLIEGNGKALGTDFSMSDSMNRNENVTDESAMDLAAADDADNINHSELFK